MSSYCRPASSLHQPGAMAGRTTAGRWPSGRMVARWILSGRHSAALLVRPRSRRHVAVNPVERLALALEIPLELRFSDRLQDYGKMGTRLQTVAHQVVACQERRRVDRAGRLVLDVISTVIDMLGVARGSQGVGSVQRQELVDPGLGQHSLELRLAKFLGLSQVLMKSDQPGDPLALDIGQPQASAQTIGDPDTDLVMAVKARSPMMIGAREWLAHIVNQRSEREREAGFDGQEPEHQHGVIPEVA